MLLCELWVFGGMLVKKQKLKNQMILQDEG